MATGFDRQVAIFLSVTTQKKKSPDAGRGFPVSIVASRFQKPWGYLVNEMPALKAAYT